MTTPRPDRIRWPEQWQPAAITAVEPYLDADARLELVQGPPTSIDGTLYAGYLVVEGDTPVIVYDRSGRADVLPWPLPIGPLLRVYLLRPGSRKIILFADERWMPRGGEKGVLG